MTAKTTPTPSALKLPKKSSREIFARRKRISFSFPAPTRTYLKSSRPHPPMGREDSLRSSSETKS